LSLDIHIYTRNCGSSSIKKMGLMVSSTSIFQCERTKALQLLFFFFE
jgi:hypothetical protein